MAALSLRGLTERGRQDRRLRQPGSNLKEKRMSLQPPDLIQRYAGAFLKPVLAKARRSRRERGAGQEAAE
jgi:hypothetical protein